MICCVEETFNHNTNLTHPSLQATQDATKIQQFELWIAKILGQLDEVEKKKGVVKLQNGKAGYIYVVSNLGSFGENVLRSE